MMKSIRHILLCALLFLAALLAFSCQKGTEKDEQGGGGVLLTLKMNLADGSLTKVTVPGDDDRNENVIEWVDLFFFSGAGGAGTEAYRTSPQSVIPVQDALDPTEYTISMFLPDNVLADIFGTEDPGSGNSATAKIVVVANGDAISSNGHYMEYPDAPSSVQGVRESVARTNFDAWYGENLNYLILCGSGDITLTHNASTHVIAAAGTIPMNRSYAKLDIALNLPPSGQLDISGRTYQADLDNMTIEVLNVVNAGYVGSDESHLRDCSTDDFISTSAYPRALTASGTPLVATHNCFYTYPRAFSDEPGKKTTYRIAIPWRAADAGENDPWRVGYYSIPVADEDTEDALYANHYYHTDASIRTLGSATPEIAEDLEGSWSILNWGDAPIYGTFNDYEYLIAQPTWVRMYGLTDGTTTYKSSSALSSYTVTEVKTYGIDMDESGTDGSETSRLVTNPTYLANYTVTHDATAHTITLHHNLELEGGPMYYRQEITVTLRNNNNLEETVVFEQKPPIEVRSTGHMGSTENFFIAGFKMGEGTALDDGDYRRPPDSGTTMNLKYNLRFTITSFPSDNNTYVFGNPAAVPVVRHEYIIGDTRVTQSKFTPSDFNTTGYNGWTQTELDKILITDDRIGSADWIAPEFITCTGYARAKPLTLAQLEMRAALYQESGYPAGRWRLMTEAEYKFVVGLQIAGKIPTFFYTGDDSPYYTAQGTCYAINAAGTSYSKVTPSNDKAYARFVYDTWYWGPDPDPASVTTYNPQP